MKDGSREYTAGDGRRFGLTVGIAFAVLTSILIWRGHLPVARVLGTVSGILIVFGAIAPRLLRPVDTAWMKFAELISKVTTPIFMGIVYYICFTPLGVGRRLLGKDSLVTKGPTAWAKHTDISDLQRQF